MGDRIITCLNCTARVAYEKDITTKIGTFRTFTTLYNIKVVDPPTPLQQPVVKCSRCSHIHFVLPSEGELNNTLQMQDRDGELLFGSSPLRVLVLYESECKAFLKEKKFDEESVGVQTMNELAGVGRLVEGTRVQQRCVALVKDELTQEGISMHIKEEVDYLDDDCSQLFEWYTKFDFAELQEEIFNQTYDFVLYILVEENRYMHWTDESSAGTEEILVWSWVCSGGNMVFGQCGLPSESDGQYGESIDFEAFVAAERSYDGGQKSLADLAEQGHFLGWWPVDDPLPSYIKAKLTECLYGRKYPEWLFRADFPQRTFLRPRRNFGARTKTVNIHDAFVPSVEMEGVLGFIQSKAKQVVDGAVDVVKNLLRI